MQLTLSKSKPCLRSAHTCKIGKVFKERRELLSLTESDIASNTSININYIKGIEQGDYSVFPARIFAIQYFRKYADFLDLRLNFVPITYFSKTALYGLISSGNTFEVNSIFL